MRAFMGHLLGKTLLRVTDGHGKPGKRWAEVIRDGAVVGTAYDSLYAGAGWCVSTREFGGYVPESQVQYVTREAA